MSRLLGPLSDSANSVSLRLCPSAGMATPAASPPPASPPATIVEPFRKSRRFIGLPPPCRRGDLQPPCHGSVMRGDDAVATSEKCRRQYCPRNRQWLDDGCRNHGSAQYQPSLKIESWEHRSVQRWQVHTT